MIKKVMISAANNRDSVLPQNKKKGNTEGQKASPKELFGSLLRSMQGKGKLQSKSTTEGNSKTEDKGEATDQSDQEKVDESLLTSSATTEDTTTKPTLSVTSNADAEGADKNSQALIDKLNGTTQGGGTEKLKQNNSGADQSKKQGDLQNVSATENRISSASNISAESSEVLKEGKQESETEKKQRARIAKLLSDSGKTKAGSKMQQGNQDGSLKGKSNSPSVQQKVVSQTGPLSTAKGQQVESTGFIPTVDEGTIELGRGSSRSQVITMNGDRVAIRKNEAETVAAKLMRLTRRLNGSVGEKGKVTSKQTQAGSESNTASSETSEEQKKILQNAFAKGKGVSPVEKSIAAKGLQAGQAQKKEDKKRLPSFANREKRAELADSSGPDQRSRQVSSSKTSTILPLGFSNTSSSASNDPEFSFDKEKIVWKGYSTEPAEVKEGKGSEQSRSAQMKLNQVSVSNITVRRKIMPSLTQNVQQAAAKAKQSPETWQKHNFVLEDGKKIHLSARQVEGVLQLKLGSLNSDLNRLLQQYQQQIKDHLKQECGTDIDLQLENNQEQEMSGFFDNESSSSGQRRRGNNQFDNQKVAPQQVNKVLLKSVRDFGYNQMEWTA